MFVCSCITHVVGIGLNFVDRKTINDEINFSVNFGSQAFGFSCFDV